jgi:hypothetical protein
MPTYTASAKDPDMMTALAPLVVGVLLVVVAGIAICPGVRAVRSGPGSLPSVLSISSYES